MPSSSPSVTPEAFLGHAWLEDDKRVAPNPDGFPTLVTKLTKLDAEDYVWPPSVSPARANTRLIDAYCETRDLLPAAGSAASATSDRCTLRPARTPAAEAKVALDIGLAASPAA